MKVIITAIVARMLGTVQKGLGKKKLGENQENSTWLLKTARIPRRNLEYYGELLSLGHKCRPPVTTGVNTR